MQLFERDKFFLGEGRGGGRWGEGEMGEGEMGRGGDGERGRGGEGEKSSRLTSWLKIHQLNSPLPMRSRTSRLTCWLNIHPLPVDCSLPKFPIFSRFDVRSLPVLQRSNSQCPKT
ncbi:hypothetical protein D0A37_17410 [Microcoleus vaginatus HSN003]|nr:hypothetical protein D0A37_17410 [Microcoleus vaginatus HSN003]